MFGNKKIDYGYRWFAGHHVSGLPGFENKSSSGLMSVVELLRNDQTGFLTFRQGKQVIRLSYQQIVNIQYGTTQTQTTKSRSALGRGLVGGALLGPVGAIAGAASGLKGKTVTSYNLTIAISYHPKDNPEATNLIEIEPTLPQKKKIKQFKAFLGIQETPQQIL